MSLVAGTRDSTAREKADLGGGDGQMDPHLPHSSTSVALSYQDQNWKRT